MLRAVATALTLLTLAALAAAQVGTDLSLSVGYSGKPGQCPRQDFGTCALQCYRDEECRGDYKCCPTACGGTTCVRPVPGNPPLTCANVRCAPGTVCVLRDPAPGCQTRCEPVPTCVSRDVCYEPVKSGPCLAYFPRYFYNAESGRCEQFIYGGCQANGNNFLTLRDCQNVCERENNGGGGGCFYKGRYYRNGAVIPTQDPCVYCTCSIGRVVCDRISCPRPPCPYPVTIPGHCCPTCPY